MKGPGDCLHVPIGEGCHVECKPGFEAIQGICQDDGWSIQNPPYCHGILDRIAFDSNISSIETSGKPCTIGNPPPPGVGDIGDCGAVVKGKSCHFSCKQGPKGEPWYWESPANGSLTCLDPGAS